EGRLPAEVATSSRLAELRRRDPRFVRSDAVQLLRVQTLAWCIRRLRRRLAVNRHGRHQVHDGVRVRGRCEGIAGRGGPPYRGHDRRAELPLDALVEEDWDDRGRGDADA